MLSQTARLKRIEHQLEVIMATQSELAAQIRAANETLGKISTESSASLAKITELQAIVDGMGNEASQELIDAVADLNTRITAIDELVPDAQTETPTETPTETTQTT